MDQITLLCIHAAYGLALVLFLAMASWRFLATGKSVEGSTIKLPLGKVEVWYFQSFDLLGIGLLVGVFYLMAVSGTMANEGDKPIELTAWAVIGNIVLQFFLAGIALIIVIRRVDPVRWLGLRWISWPWVMVIAPGTVVTIWAILAGLNGLGYNQLMTELGVEQVQDTVKIFRNEKDIVVLVLMGFTASVVAPICEEVVFRGYLYPAMKHFVGPWFSAFCTSLIFSAAHGNVSALLPLFIVGLAMAALYEFTGSIWAPIAAHFLFNSATVVVLVAIRIFDLPVPI